MTINVCNPEVVPTPESYWGKVNSIGPRSCYDEGKRFAEALLVAYHKQYGLDVNIPRIFNSYGLRLREDGLYGRAMSRFIMQALADLPITIYGDGRQTRPFCYITDTVTGLMLLTSSDKAKDEVVNVGNTQEVTILELAKKIKALTKCKSPLTFQPLPKDDPRRRCPDTSKLEKLVGWKPNMIKLHYWVTSRISYVIILVAKNRHYRAIRKVLAILPSFFFGIKITKIPIMSVERAATCPVL